MITLDCTGMLCPRPVIELARAFSALEVGEELTLVSDDPAAAVDVAAWCRMTGQGLVASRPAEGDEPGSARVAYVIRRLTAT